MSSSRCSGRLSTPIKCSCGVCFSGHSRSCRATCKGVSTASTATVPARSRTQSATVAHRPASRGRSSRLSWSFREPERADLRSDPLLSYALRRMGIALEIADVCAFEVREQLIEFLLSSYLRPSLAGYSNISIEQLHCADREVWRYLAISCRSIGHRARGEMQFGN